MFQDSDEEVIQDEILKERICLFENYSKEELKKIKEALSSKMQEFVPSFKVLLDYSKEKQVQNALLECEEFSEDLDIKHTDGYKMCVICGYDNDALFFIIKSIKYIVNKPGLLIFSKAHKSSITMKVRRIFEENVSDHEYIKKYGIRPPDDE